MPEDGEPITVRTSSTAAAGPPHTPGAVINPGQDKPDAGASDIPDVAASEMPDTLAANADNEPEAPEVEDTPEESPAENTANEPLEFDENSFDTEEDTPTTDSFVPVDNDPSIPDTDSSQPSAPTPVLVANKPSKSPKGKIIAAVIAVVLAALAGGGVWYWQQQEVSNLQDQVSSLQSQLKTSQAKEATETTTTETEEAVPAGFTEVTNSDLGVSLYQPDDWTSFAVTAENVSDYTITTADQIYSYNTKTKEWDNSKDPIDQLSEVKVVRLDEDFTVWGVSADDADGCTVTTYYTVVGTKVGVMETPAVCASDNADQEAGVRNTLVFSIMKASS